MGLKKKANNEKNHCVAMLKILYINNPAYVLHLMKGYKVHHMIIDIQREIQKKKRLLNRK